MPDFLLAAWAVAVKWPLSFLADALFLGPFRRRAAADFPAWARGAVAAGPEGVARAVAARVKYRADPLGGLLDYVAAPEVTWGRGIGDCDDFSYLTAELLRRARFDSWLASYFCWNVKDSHVVCLYRDGAAFGLIDQGQLRRGYRSLYEAATAAQPESGVAARYVRRYGLGADLIGRWIVRTAKR
jgi:hypothetical protein